MKQRGVCGVISDNVTFTEIDNFGGEVETTLPITVTWCYPEDARNWQEIRICKRVFREGNWDYVPLGNRQINSRSIHITHKAIKIALESQDRRKRYSELTPSQEKMLLPLHGE